MRGRRPGSVRSTRSASRRTASAPELAAPRGGPRSAVVRAVRTSLATRPDDPALVLGQPAQRPSGRPSRADLRPRISTCAASSSSSVRGLGEAGEPTRRARASNVREAPWPSIRLPSLAGVPRPGQSQMASGTTGSCRWNEPPVVDLGPGAAALGLRDAHAPRRARSCCPRPPPDAGARTGPRRPTACSSVPVARRPQMQHRPRRALASHPHRPLARPPHQGLDEGEERSSCSRAGSANTGAWSSPVHSIGG